MLRPSLPVLRVSNAVVPLIIAAVTVTLSYAAWAALAPGVATSSEPVQRHLTTHRAVRDSKGHVLAWYRPQQTLGYDHVLRLDWRFMERKVPSDQRWKTGLPVHLVSSVFDGATKAVRCGAAMTRSAHAIGLPIRVGIHTGEIEFVGDDVRGVAVHAAARVMSLAGPDEVLVSSTTADLLEGSGLALEDAGTHELKGLSGRRKLYRLALDGSSARPG